MAEKPILGVPSPRVEGEEKVAGKAVYAVDVALPGMLWVKLLRSPLAHARIKRIDTSRAKAVPGVKVVLTGKEIAGIKIGKKIIDMPLLADDVVRFVGEKVAAVAADSEAHAEEAIDCIDVEYEELPVVTDVLAALAPKAPLLHPEVGSYKGLLQKIHTPSNAVVQLTWKKGDVVEGFRQSDLVVENTFEVPAVHQAYIEPHACVVRAHQEGFEVWASTKSPYALRDQVGNAVNIAPAKIVVHPCYVGGDFGGKGDSNDVALCYEIAKRAGAPVKVIFDYSEELIAGNPRHGALIKVRTGVKRNGLMIAEHIELLFDSGAYSSYRPQGYLVGAHDASGPYRIANCLVEERYVYTNKMPAGYMRAPGHVQGFFASESQRDLIARKLGMDPAEFRRMNFMRDGEPAPLGEHIHHIRPEETLAKALEVSHARAAKNKNIGLGCAIGNWVSKGGESYSFVRIDEQGGVTLSSAVIDTGPGVYSIMRQIVGQELKVSLEDIRVEPWDTSKVIKDTGVRGSSSTRVHGSSAYAAAVKAREAVLQAAAQAMNARPEELMVYEGGVIHGRREQRMSLADIVRAHGAPIVAEGHYANMSDGPESSLVAQVAEVEVDDETGAVTLRRLTTAHNTGTILNTLTHQGQIDGAAVMGIGYGVMEGFLNDENGRVVTANLGEYKIPNIKDVPELTTAIVQSNVGSGPYNSMSIGEHALIPTAAAIANAVEDAVGVRITSLPITAEKVLAALKQKGA